jgi:hypothetical protein
MNIVLADIEAKQLADRASCAGATVSPVLAVEMDVALRDDWERTARAAARVSAACTC